MKNNLLIFLIITFSGLEVMGQSIPKLKMVRQDDGTIIKRELILEHDGGGKCCLLFISKTKKDSPSNYQNIFFGAREYETSKKIRRIFYDKDIISLYFGEPQGFFSFLDECDKLLLIEDAQPGNRHKLNGHTVELNKFLGTKYINVWAEGKGWVHIGAKVINRTKKKFYKWAKAKGIQVPDTDS